MRFELDPQLGHFIACDLLSSRHTRVKSLYLRSDGRLAVREFFERDNVLMFYPTTLEQLAVDGNWDMPKIRMRLSALRKREPRCAA